MSVSREELRNAATRLRAAGLTAAADDFDSILESGWTSSSELLGEIGLRIVRLLRDHRENIPMDVRTTLEAMLVEVEKNWPGIRRRE